MNNKQTEYKSILRILKNIETKGTKRYDPTDIRDLPIANLNSKIGKPLRYFTLFLEQLSPLLIRKVFNVKKSENPTTFVYLAESSYLLRDLLVKEKYANFNCYYWAEQLIDNYYDKKSSLWKYKENLYSLDISNNAKHIPSMPLHGLARINILLLKLPDKENYVEISKKSLEALLYNHNVYSDNKLFYVSYHYNTKDCTLNVNSELLEWIIRLNEMKPNPDYEKMAVGIINLILTEQNMDGSWNYFSRDYAKSQGIKNDCPDLHHTATILQNLTESIIIAKFLDPNLKRDILNAIIKGFRYAFNTFFKIKRNDLIATTYPWGRTAGPVQLSEMLLSIDSFITYYKTCENQIPDSFIQECQDLASAISTKLCTFVKSDGSVPSEKIFRWININSIRWGNGIVLQALAEQYIKNLNE